MPQRRTISLTQNIYFDEKYDAPNTIYNIAYIKRTEKCISRILIIAVALQTNTLLVHARRDMMARQKKKTSQKNEITCQSFKTAVKFKFQNTV